MDLVPGTRIGDRYVLVARIGGGGMGEVWLAVMEGAATFRRKVVVKCLPAGLQADDRLRAMLRDEARILGLLHHPNIVAPVDYVEGAGSPVLVLEYIDGPSLQAVLRAARRAKQVMPEALVAWIGSEVARALHAAHLAVDERGQSLGLVHRDVSPDNILFSRDGRVHLSDFGVARARGNSDETQPGRPKGKRGYMPPEQAAGRALGPTADVFALGRVVAEAADVGCGVVLREVLDRAVAARSTDRFPSCAVFGEALLAVCPPMTTDWQAELAAWIARLMPESREEAQRPDSGSSPQPERTPPRPSPPARSSRREEPELFLRVGASGRSRTVRIVAAIGVVGVALWLLLPGAWIALHGLDLEHASEHLPGLSEPKGWLHVRSLPSSAEVYVDGQLRGLTPLALRLVVGPHTLRVASPSQGKVRALDVKISSGAHENLQVDLSR